MVAPLFGVGAIGQVESPGLTRLAFGVADAGLEERGRVGPLASGRHGVRAGSGKARAWGAIGVPKAGSLVRSTALLRLPGVTLWGRLTGGWDAGLEWRACFGGRCEILSGDLREGSLGRRLGLGAP